MKMKKLTAPEVAILAIGALVVAGAMLDAAGVLAAAAVHAPDIVRVEVARTSPTACGGSVDYLINPQDADLSDLAVTRRLMVSVPCARLDALEALGQRPPARGGKVLVDVASVTAWRTERGRCDAEVVRTIAPVDDDLASVTGAVRDIRFVADIPCARLSATLSGAEVTGKAGWPEAHVALPLPEAVVAAASRVVR
jgi:hypothetical protein